jgi:hypothetical protein
MKLAIRKQVELQNFIYILDTFVLALFGIKYMLSIFYEMSS